MPQGSVNLRLRPLKLAFLVDPSETKVILEIVKLNTFYWGGAYNPIIPIFKRPPKLWDEKPFRRGSKAAEIFSGYLEAYDPDFVVPMGKIASRNFDVGNRKILQSSELLEGVERDGTPRYGIGLFEIFQYFIRKELKFVRKKPINVCLPQIGRTCELALAAIFGILPDKMQDIFSKFYAHEIEAKMSPCSLDNYTEFLEPTKLFLRRFSSLYIKPVSSGGGSRDQCVFFFDGKNNWDVIDYWNLRAIGWNVIPVLKRGAEDPAVKKMVVDFIEENYAPYRHNPDMFYYTTLLKGRSVPENEMKQFADSLQIAKPKKDKDTKYVMQFWYPQIWDEWFRDRNGAGCFDLEADTAQHEVNTSDEEFSVRTLDPKFINKFGGHGEPRFANEVGIRFSGESEINAEVIPEGDDNLVRAVAKYSYDEWRFSKKGMIYLSQHTDWRIGLHAPKADELFLAWLKYKNLDAKISDSALTAKQMIKCLGGVWGISTLAEEGVIQLLEKMSSQKPINKKALFGEMKRIANQRKFPRDAHHSIKRFIDSKIVQLGINVQCSMCRRHSWYSVKEADYELLCGHCGVRFSIPSHSPDEIDWAYRTYGPFSLPAQGQGIYTVLLAVRFFSHILRGSNTAIPGFKLKKIDKEIDLGIFFRESMFGNTKTELIFIECKTYNSFVKEDADRMLLLAKEFPGAIIAFATLKKELSSQEKRILSKVANLGRKYMKSDRPYNPVLILTGTELFAEMSLSHAWEEASAVHKSFSHRSDLRHIVELCDMTQQIYLGLKPWRDSWREKWERRRQRKSKPVASIAV